MVDPQRALAGCRVIPAQEVGGHLEENAPAPRLPRDAQVITEIVVEEDCVVRRMVMSDASEFLNKWVRKSITSTTAHVRDDTLTAGRLAEECLWEAQAENLSAAEVTDAAGGNLLSFMMSELNRAADQKSDRERE